jgi:hypothetical protein
VLAAVPDHDLGDYDALYETTNQPCDYLWGPSTPDDAAEWLRQHPQPGDQAETTDRLFLLRYHDDRLYLPQKPAVAASLTGPATDGTWYWLRADAPILAFHRQRCALSRYTDPESGACHDPSGDAAPAPPSQSPSGACPTCSPALRSLEATSPRAPSPTSA